MLAMYGLRSNKNGIIAKNMFVRYRNIVSPPVVIKNYAFCTHM